MCKRRPCVKPLLAGVIAAVLAVALSIPARAQGERVGSAAEILPNANGYCQESALGDLVADALRSETGADAAIVFSGDLEQYLPAGELTAAEVEAAIPENTPYAVATLTPAELTAVLEQGLSHITLTEGETIDYTRSECDDFPQVSGLSLRVDAAALPGERVLDVTLSDGTQLSGAQTLTVALPAAALDEAQRAGAVDCGGVREVFLAYLAANSPLKKPQLDRIRLLGAHTNELISSAPVLMVGIIVLICAVMMLPAILRRERDPEAREALYLTGGFRLKNRN